MRHPDAVYRGHRGADLLLVTVDGEPLTPRRSHRVHFHAAGFEWGYSGAGPHQLALAVLLDALDDPRLARKWSAEFMWHFANETGDTWSVSAGFVRRWVEAQEAKARPNVRRCRVCGCTDEDCRQCVEVLGEPCCWVAGEPDLCSRCAMELYGDELPPAPARKGGAR